ncbi:MAG: hypothetical protein KTR31_35285 [Myxococcales bacterium]|nr:hypothetical protein [Myxococcales bacterium]
MFWLSLLACPDPSGGTDTDVVQTDTTTVEPEERHHPAGYAEPSVHGTEAKLQEQVCRACHGDGLQGGISQVSCTTCHAQAGFGGWDRDCTFCHGSGDDPAPPEDIDDNTDPASISFPEHTNHTAETEQHDPYDCIECHVLPADVLSDGHLFVGDDTPGVAEVFWPAGQTPPDARSPDAVYDAATSTCTNVYCHGAGLGRAGEVSSGDNVVCGGCHGVAVANQLSVPHRLHINAGVDCDSCHPTAVREPSWEIVDKSLHIDGEITMISTPGGLTWDADSRACTGSCHGKDTHPAKAWNPVE